MRKKKQLYVFTQFCCDYTDGLAVVIATSEEEARQRICEKMGYDPGEWNGFGDCIVHSLTDDILYYVCGGG